jgi:ribulose kinase
MTYCIAVDVGSRSVRSALVSLSGEIIAVKTADIQVWNPQPDYYEQSSRDIWSSIIKVVQKTITQVSPDQILAISFDATCSL